MPEVKVLLGYISKRRGGEGGEASKQEGKKERKIRKGEKERGKEKRRK